MPRRHGCTPPTMPTEQQWLRHWPAIRQWWLVEEFTGNEVAEKLATLDFYVKGSQVDYRARKWGFRKRLPVDMAASGNRTDENSQSSILEQRDGDDSAASHQTNMELNLLEQAQLGSVWAAGESDTSRCEHVHFTAFSGPSSGGIQPWDHRTVGANSYSSHHDKESLDNVGSRCMTTQDEPSSQHSQGLQGQYDPGASADYDVEGLFEPRGHQAGFFDTSHNNDGFTELGIDPLTLPMWEPINCYGESHFAYDTDAESGQEDTQ